MQRVFAETEVTDAYSCEPANLRQKLIGLPLRYSALLVMLITVDIVNKTNKWVPYVLLSNDVSMMPIRINV